ncbi:MAG: hypothetical protein IT430_09845 [Phycisphaerales bacterium]|nr:hypothetical protein [Phycisphaerales bacterium]
MSDSKYYIVRNPIEQTWDRTRTTREASDRHRFIGQSREATARTNADGTQSIVEVAPREGAPQGVRIVAGPMTSIECRDYLAVHRRDWLALLPNEEGR